MNTFAKPILGFSGDHRFLSNFYHSPMELDGILYHHAEGAYQASKTDDVGIKKLIASLVNPGEAKRFWNSLVVQEFLAYSRAEWHSGIGVHHMMRVVDAKYEQNPEMKQLLLDTGDSWIVEFNTWGDKFWGMVKEETSSIMVGENHLGKIHTVLRMKYRGEGLGL